MSSRRVFLEATLSASLFAIGGKSRAEAKRKEPSQQELEQAAARPVVNTNGLSEPVVIKSMELLRNGQTFIVRVRTRDGAEGISIPNSSRMRDCYPIFLNRVAPFFIGKDARQLELLLWDLYRYRSNYKYQGLPFWVSVAAAEFAILDLLGRVGGRSIGELIGPVLKNEIAVYRASGNRGNTPRAEIEHLQRLVEETGATALKYRAGGRMSKNRDSLPGRTETLIPLVRETFGPKMTLYIDSNSSYDAACAIKIGRLLEEHNYGFFEEPCRFDHLEETREVAKALKIPIAGGEQEYSDWRFRWMIQHRAVDIVQPDLHYHGGYIRSKRVARMAELAGMTCAPHMSGSGLGYVDMLHFVSTLPNAAPHHEFKGNTDLPVTCETSSLRCEKGKLTVPTGPGSGVKLDPAFFQKAKIVKGL